MREPEGGEVSDVVGHPSMNQSIEEYSPPPPETGEAGILQYERMEDRGAEVGSRIPGSPAVFPSSVAGEEEKEPAASGVAGADDSMEEEAIQVAMTVVVEPQVEPRCPTSHAVSPSSSAGEDNKALVLEPHEAATTGDAGGDDVMEEEAVRMAVDLVEPQLEPRCIGSPLESPSSSAGEDKKGPVFGPDTAATSGFAGGDDALKEEAAQMAVDAMEPHRLGSPVGSLSSGGGENKKDLAFETDEATTSAIGGGEGVLEEEVEQIAVEAAESPVVRTRRGGGRRKRSRPSRVQGVRAPARKKEEEEVCFICFDGGDLVVCDRRGCPKVYHPSCVNRDEAFFRAKGRWNCGWHICSICEKSAHYMCYTCTYSLCKGCVREAGFICVRETKGFCETCMSTVMLIETDEHGNEKDGVDFDDRSSWEFLFKDYWLDLKGKLSLTLEELKRARTPQKDYSLTYRNEESSNDFYDAKDDQQASADSSSGHPEGRISSRKKAEEIIPARKKGKKRSRKTSNKDLETSSKDLDLVTSNKDLVNEPENTGTSTSEDISWASKELLEFVGHMKDGDVSELSQFDVQALLLEYIKRNNLRDQRRKSQIICDSRLENLFGQSRVGHFEMLKLLELHFLMKEASPLDTDDNQGGVVDPDPSQMDVEGNSDASIMMTSDRRRKPRKKVEEKEPQTNLDDFAAIDVRNISLMYLRRNLMEDLLDDIDTFNEKVVGSFVRIRISGAGQRQDLYRLVQVKGTCKVAEKYKSGKKTTNVKLEILNLDKTEVITIDSISNQEFTEEECKRLRQSIKCGFIARLTVGEVQEKARALQAVRVNDWLESEKLRLAHLRDRASEKGRIKEHRECVEKLQLLNTPEEQKRRLNEIPEIHADPNMNPDYESAEEEKEPDSKRQEHADHYSRLRTSACPRKGKEASAPGRGISISSDNWNAARKNSNMLESNRIILTEGTSKPASGVGITKDSSWNRGNDVQQTSSCEPSKTLAKATGLEADIRNHNQCGLRSGESSSIRPETPAVSLSTSVSAPSNTSESEKIWHYQDPSGKIQGPFSMIQLRKWSTTGYFPSNLKIWRTSGRQEDSILLTDALIGKFQNDLLQHEPAHKSILQSRNVATTIDRIENNLESGWRGNNNSALTESKQNVANWKASQNDANLSSTGMNEMVKADRLVSHLPASSALKTEVINPNEGGLGTTSRDHESSKGMIAWPGQMRGWNITTPAAPFSGSPYQSLSHQSRGSRGGDSGRWNGGQDHGSNWGSNKPMGLQPVGQAYDKLHLGWSSSSQQFPEDMTKVQMSDSPNQSKNDSSNLPTAPQSGNRGSTSDQGALNKSFPSNTSVETMISDCGTTPSGNEAHQSSYVSGDFNNSAMSESVEGCGAVSVSHMLEQTVTADGKSTYPAVMASMPNAAEVVETMGSSQLPEKVDNWGTFQMSCQQKNPPEHESSTILENRLSHELPCRYEDIPVSADTKLVEGLDKNQCPESDRTSTTPRCKKALGDVLSSVCSEIAPSRLDGRQDHPLAWHGEYSHGKKWAEAHDRLASRGSDTDYVDAQDTESDALESESAEKLKISSGPDSGSESRALTCHSAPKQKHDSSYLNPALAENRSEQIQYERSEPNISSPPEYLNSHNLGVPSDGKSIVCTMPAPALKMISSGWSGSTDSTIGGNQNVQLLPLDSSKTLASSHCEASVSAEPAQPSNAGLSVVANVQNPLWGAAPQNPNTGTGPQGNANMNWAMPTQANMNMDWGLIAQSNMNMAWGQPAQVVANFNMGLGTPPQANMYVNAGLVPPAQGNTNSNPTWGTPFQMNPNPNSGWGAQVQGSMTANPGWSTFPQGNIKPNPGLVMPPPLGNTNQNASWGTPTQGNMDANSSSAWGSGQGNLNTTWDPSAGDLNSWNTPQTQAADRHSGQGVSDLGHAAGRPLWNKMQPGGGGGSSQPPSRGQRGICRFHENGHCKKGASCNYIHS